MIQVWGSVFVSHTSTPATHKNRCRTVLVGGGRLIPALYRTALGPDIASS